jgi:hypothetical protein
MAQKSSKQFFYDNAAFSYTPGKESRDAGRVRCAKALAAAETTKPVVRESNERLDRRNIVVIVGTGNL